MDAMAMSRGMRGDDRVGKPRDAPARAVGLCTLFGGGSSGRGLGVDVGTGATLGAIYGGRCCLRCRRGLSAEAAWLHLQHPLRCRHPSLRGAVEPFSRRAAEFVEWRSNSPARYLRDEHGRAFSVRKIVGVAQSSRRVASDELRNRRFFRTRAKQCPGSLFAVMLLL